MPLFPPCLLFTQIIDSLSLHLHLVHLKTKNRKTQRLKRQEVVRGSFLNEILYVYESGEIKLSLAIVSNLLIHLLFTYYEDIYIAVYKL